MKDKQYTLLIVDDNLDNVELLEEILIGQGCRILTALNGHDAVKLAANQQPDLILLDIAMPVMDGLEVLEVLKSNQTTLNIPVMFITGVAINEKILHAIQNGLVVDCISKPIVISELIEKIEACLRNGSKKI
ncbi:MAG: response regulator [Bacteroidales bacterium]|nr:response regulator [Bacteroidales bacterium]